MTAAESNIIRILTTIRDSGATAALWLELLNAWGGSAESDQL